MIVVEIKVDDIDYNDLIEQYLPRLAENLRRSNNPIGMLLSNGMSISVAKTILQGLTKEKKEQLAIDFINGNSDLIAEKIKQFAAMQNTDLKVAEVTAHT